MQCTVLGGCRTCVKAKNKFQIFWNIFFLQSLIFRHLADLLSVKNVWNISQLFYISSVIKCCFFLSYSTTKTVHHLIFKKTIGENICKILFFWDNFFFFPLALYFDTFYFYIISKIFSLFYMKLLKFDLFYLCLQRMLRWIIIINVFNTFAKLYCPCNNFI